MANIKFGANTIDSFEVEGGDTVEQAFDHIRDFFQMENSNAYDVLVNRRPALFTDRINAGDTIEFVQKAGAKA
jgi:hypothetical protein